jgi:TetR/AcrR family transcriptional repressor of nem operon
MERVSIMRVTREQAQANRERVVEAAARLFRERGFEGVGVAELMKSVGLTHGGFYGQFGSKEELAAEACELAFERSVEKWQRALEKRPGAGAQAIAATYLTRQHVDAPGNGCAAAALATDFARQSPQVRQVLDEGVNALVETLAAALPERTHKARRRHALGSFSAMVGAVVLGRAVADGELAEEILDAAREQV